jgi:hypothetical protein
VTHRALLLGVALAAFATACGGDDTSLAPADAAAPGPADATADVSAPPPPDGDADQTAASIPTRLLLSGHADQESELVALDIITGRVVGRYAYPGARSATAVTARDPYLLERGVGAIARMDRTEPWIPRSTWNVPGDPVAIATGPSAKAYVLASTGIAVIDESQNADGGRPLATIDVAGDAAAPLAVAGGVYVASKGLVYVALTDATGCTGPSRVVAVDVGTDRLVPLAGSPSDGALPLLGASPLTGPLVYDAAEDRLLIATAGCTTASGGVFGRGVEELSLFTGRGRALLDLSASGPPTAFVFVDAHRALLQVAAMDTYAWDPVEAVLGARIPNAPESFAYDGAGNLVGLRAVDLSVVSVRIADGRAVPIATNPFALAGAQIGEVAFWPPR